MANEIDIARLKELATKATPGPWEFTGRAKVCAYRQLKNGMRQFVLARLDYNPGYATANAAYIAAASPDVVLALIAENERLEKLSELWKHDYEELAASASDARKKNECLEKEADWLAAKLEYHTDPYACDFGQGTQELFGSRCHLPLNKQNCVKCWREAARKTVQAARHE